jgi:hypothetical protein
MDSVGKSPRKTVAGLNVSLNMLAARKLVKRILVHLAQADTPVFATINSGVAQ